MAHTKDKRVGFCVGTGRCGTTFITKLAEDEPEVAASHERLRLPATFHMYCKWHGIPVDPEGFLADRDEVIRDDHRDHRVSFEASALLSHSLLELHERFDARVLLLVRRPDETVASFAARGWFLDPIAWANSDLPPTIREGNNPRHFFGRNLPRGDEFARWSALTQIGKLAWFWKARNRAILEQFQKLPKTHVRVQRLEDFDHAAYVALADFLGWSATVSEARFLELATSRPNAGPNPPLVPSGWSDQDIAEFQQEVAPLSHALGYQHAVEHLLAGDDARVLPRESLSVPDILARLR